MGHAVEDKRAVSEAPGPEVVMAAGDLGVAAPYDGWPAETLSLPGEITLSVRTTPSAPDAAPAVMVHGLGGSALNWTTSSALLADRLAARAPDLPGFGDSPPPHDGDYSLNTHMRAVEALIEADGRGPVHLMGNSMGGAVAVPAGRPAPRPRADAHARVAGAALLDAHQVAQPDRHPGPACCGASPFGGG